jgi:hypothetical protein
MGKPITLPQENPNARAFSLFFRKTPAPFSGAQLQVSKRRIGKEQLKLTAPEQESKRPPDKEGSRR